MNGEHSVREKKANIIGRLWRGDVPLWKTYWIYGSLVGIIVNLSITWFAYQIYYYASDATELSKFDIYAISYTILAVVTLYTLLITGGVWRSASNYKILHPDRRIYGNLAQIAAVFGVMAFVGSLALAFDNTNNSIHAILKSGTPEQRLQLDATIAGLNKGLPKMIDSVTILDKVGLDSHGYTYFETITVKLDSADVLQTRVKPTIAKGLCEEADTLSGLKSGLSFHYVYSDSDGNHVGDIVVTKADCST